MKRAATLLIVLTVIRGLLYSAIIPPWQAPDETAHFETSALLCEDRHLLAPVEASPALQHEILSSLYEHDFWRYVFRQAPERMPLSLSEAPFIGQVSTLSRLSLSYYLNIPLCALTKAQDIVVQLYVLRVGSVLLGAVVVWLAFMSAREIWPRDRFVLLTAPVFVAFLPMHTYVTSSVSDGNLAEVLSSLHIYLLLRGLRRGLSLLSSLAIGLLIVLALWTKVTAFFTLPLTLLYIPIYLSGRKERLLASSRSRVALMLGILFLLAALTVPLSPKYGSLLRPLFGLARPSVTESQPPSAREYLYAVQTTFESFWAKFGWMALSLDQRWYMVIAVLSLTAAAGLVLMFVRVTWHRRPLHDVKRRALLLLALAVTLSVSSLLLVFLLQRRGIYLSQGRYLYPAIVPVALLFMLGLRELVPFKHRDFLLAACTTAFVLFDSFVLMFYVIPFFYSG